MMFAAAVPKHTDQIVSMKSVRDALLKVANDKGEGAVGYELRMSKAQDEMTLLTGGDITADPEWFVGAQVEMIFNIHLNAYTVGGGVLDG